MRLSIARASAGSHTQGDTMNRDDTGYAMHGAGWRRMALALAVVLLLGSVGILVGSTKPAGADTPLFASGQVFASVGNSAVSVYSQGAGNPLVTRLNDGLQEPYTAGSAFDSSGNFYVTDDLTGDVSEYAPDGTLDGVFASGLQNPLSLAFDNQGNLYVGQQTTPYIAEFSKTGQFIQNIGPLATELSGDDWIALAPDECTVYYTTEETDILRYNMCTNQQLPNLNVQAFPTFDASTSLPVQAFQLQILPNGNVLVADSNADILLDPNGNVLQTYTCASLPGCQGSLFAMSLDPDGNSFWTGDSTSGDVWKVDIASGDVLQQINTHSGTLFGLSVDDQIEVAAPPPVTNTVPSTLTVQPVTGNFSTPTPVSAVLTNPTTGMPIVNEPVTFTLNGSESCTATTDSTGTATCDITAGEPSSSYTLTATFPGDTTTSTPIGSNSSTNTFTVNPDTSALTYTGATAAVNGQPTTLSGTLTTDTPTTGTPLPTKVVTFTVGSGTTAQSCSGTTDASGRCQLPHHHGRSAERDGTDHGNVRRRQLRHPGHDDEQSLGDRAHDADRESDHRELRRHDHRVGHVDRHEPQPAGPQRAGHLHGEQHRDLHRHDGLQRARLVHRDARRVDRKLHGRRFVHRRRGAAGPVDEQLELGGLRGDARRHHVDLHGRQLDHQRPAGDVVRCPHDREHASRQPARHPDAGFRRLRPDLRRDDGGHGRRQLHHSVGQPAARAEPGQRHLPRDEQLPASQCDEHRPGGPGPGVHHVDGELCHRDLRQSHHSDGDADQQLHQHPRGRRDRHPQAERDPVVHGDDQRIRCGDVHHHAVRAGWHLHAERLIRR